jgi:hypothetical protein
MKELADYGTATFMDCLGNALETGNAVIGEAVYHGAMKKCTFVNCRALQND